MKSLRRLFRADHESHRAPVGGYMSDGAVNVARGSEIVGDFFVRVMRSMLLGTFA